MRTSTIFSAAFAAGALASPVIKRDVVVDTVYNEVYVTQMVTVTAGDEVAATSTLASTSTEVPPPPPSSAPASSAAPVQHADFWAWSSAWTSTYVYTEAASSVAVASSTAVASSSVVSSVAASSSAISSVAASSSEPASSSSVAATSTSAAASSSATSYQEIVVAHHNVHRSNHSASALTWNDTLASTAASIAATCIYEHNMTTNGGGYGQNIAAGVESNNVSAVITDLFYNGEVGYFASLYGQADPDMTNFESWGHFSQIVWKDTTSVGCATYDCSSSGLSNTGGDVSPYFTVCNYYPPGNYAGEYADNIGDSLNRATVEWNYDL